RRSEAAANRGSLTGGIEHDTLRSAQQLTGHRVSFVPGPGVLRQTFCAGQRFIVHLQFVRAEYPGLLVLLATNR
ncbi:MAG TPA: hypothetical protein PKM43_22025, partial [Verrucomicrobiota bacterium]|nr:hypothetical protein [Verrucomicrobiota bacterium]